MICLDLDQAYRFGGAALRSSRPHSAGRRGALRLQGWRDALRPLLPGGTYRSEQAAQGARAGLSWAGLAAAGPADAKASARFRDTMLPHLDAAYNLARFLCRDADAANDIVQDAYLRAFRAFGTFRGGSARAWILSIVRNCHRDWIVERRRHAAEPLGEEADPGGADRGIASDEPTPEASLLQQADAAEVRSTLDRLPEAFREVLVLRELEDLSYREIAEITATPIGTVMSRLARARKAFAQTWLRRSKAEDPA